MKGMFLNSDMSQLLMPGPWNTLRGAVPQQENGGFGTWHAATGGAAIAFTLNAASVERSEPFGSPTIITRPVPAEVVVVEPATPEVSVDPVMSTLGEKV